MKQLNGKVAVVTGAASGIGRALAINLAREGCRLALSDVNKAGLEETLRMLSSKSSNAKTYLVDCADRAEVEQFAESVNKDFGQIDMVINNAGIASKGDFDAVPYEVFEKVINVNLWGVVYGSRAFMPFLKARSESSLVNISSINAMMPFPSNGPYNISKYAVYGLNETLLMELKDTSVQVTSVHPGGIKTNIANNAEEMSDEEKKAFNKLLMTTPDSAARQIITGIKKKQSHVFVGPDAKLFQLIKRISPKAVLALSKKLMSPVTAQKLKMT